MIEKDLKEYITFPVFTRWVFTLILLVLAYRETGIYTATILFLIFIGMETYSFLFMKLCNIYEMLLNIIAIHDTKEKKSSKQSQKEL